MTGKTSPTVREVIEESLGAHRSAFSSSFDPERIRILEKIADGIVTALRKGGKILLCGNGGSAADAQHIAAEFIGRFKLERKSLTAIALTTDTSILTSIANDYAYEKIFSRQIEGLGQAGDLLIAISTSGNSRNVLEAIASARSLGLMTVGFTGRNGGQMKDEVDLLYRVESDATSHIQEMHITALHAVSEAVESTLFPSS